MGVIAKYKFNNTLEANLLPEFNSEFTSDLYTVTDEVNGEVTTRTIESDSLPTLMRFGRTWVEGETDADNRTDSLLEVSGMNTSGLIDCNSMFRYNTNLTSITCEWDTSNVTSMQQMFHNCKNLISLEVSNFNTRNVATMYAMFYNCTNLTSLDVSNWDTSNVTNMRSIFEGCNNLTTLDVINFDTSKVTNMSNMFAYCNNLTSLDVSNWNVSKVTTMSQMFRLCEQLIELDVSNWDTSNVNNMASMLTYCTNLTSLDLSSFRLDKCTSIYDMFAYCHNIETIILPDEFCTSGTVTNMQGVFYQNYKLKEINVSNWNTSKVTTMQSMFHNCNNLTILDVGNWDTNNVNNMYDMFNNCSGLKYLKCNNIATLNKLNTHLPTKTSASQGTIICKADITNLDTTTLQSKNWNILDEPTLIAKYVFDKSIYNNCIPEFNTEFEGYFIEDEVVEGNNEVTRTIESCGMLPTLMRFGTNILLDINYKQGDEVSLISIEYLNTENLTSCNMMFKQCSNLVIVNTEGWDISKVTDMYSMFYYCNNLTSLDVSNWDTSNVLTMQYMFAKCNNLTTLDVSNWDTSNVLTMGVMFLNCNNLTSLDVSNWDTSKVTDMNSMFCDCHSLTSLNVSNFDTSNVTDMQSMFGNTPLLADISVLYMDKSSLQKLVDAIPTNSNKTLWYKDVNIEGITHGDNITLKKYKEENVEIVLNSPLLEGDRIEVKDGKLCHYHKMGKVVLDGNRNWISWGNETQPSGFTSHYVYYNKYSTTNLGVPMGKHLGTIYTSTLNNNKLSGYKSSYQGINSVNDYLTITLSNDKLGVTDTTSKENRLNAFLKWLQVNPTIMVYELTEPYYEDITNLQSAPTLKTFLECSMEIDTDLPIDTNVTYRTNLSSVYVMERELDELDNGIDLGDILEGEVNK